MGCDIHMAVEVQGSDGAWRAVWPKEHEPCWACSGDPDGRTCERCRGARTTPKRWWHDRNYLVFAVLAGVRNYECDPPIVPIAPPRGLPDDLSDELRSTCGDEDGYSPWWFDHTPSWLRLDEVMSFDWCGRVEKFSGMAWSGRGHPAQWCGAVGGSSVECVTPDEMQRRIKSGRDLHQHLYTTIEWNESLLARCGSFIDWAYALPRVLDAPPERIRLIFGFDS